MNKEKDIHIIKGIFHKYIFKNPVNRMLMFPVIVIMILAKYLEVCTASQTKEISKMIQNNTSKGSVIFSYAFVTFLGVLFVEFQSFLICKAGTVGFRMSNRDTLRYFLNLDPQNYNSIGKGEIQSTVLRKSQSIQDMIDVITLNFFPTFLTLVFVSVEVLRSLGLTCVLIINLAILIYSVSTIKISSWRNQMRKDLIKAQNMSSDNLMDCLSNYETIFSYNTEEFEVNRYNNSLKGVENNLTNLTRSMYFLNFIQKSIWSFMTIFIIINIVFYNRSSMNTGNFVFLLHIISILIRSLDNLGFMYGKFQAALINARLTQLSPRKNKVEGYRTLYRFSDSVDAKNIKIDIGDKTIISDGVFKINKSDKVAIIGRNGSGKSSLIKSLVNLIESEGSVKIDGIETRDISDSSYKGLISYIPQNVILFDTSVMNNIKYGNYKVSDEEVYRISKNLGIHESIIMLENGYETLVGEQGKNLSGGERQKIMILRSVLRQSQIVLMDEATSALDRQSEMKIMTKILGNEEITVMAIVHNLELLEYFNKILWIHNNKIEEVQNLKDIDINSWYDIADGDVKSSVK